MKSESTAKWIEMKKQPRPQPAASSAVPHRIRPYNAAADEALVYKSYLISFLKTGYRMYMDCRPMHGPAGDAIKRKIYDAGQRSVLEGILQHAQVSIACGVEDEWQVLGFMIYDDLPSGLVLHYIYVKKVFRRTWLAMEMIDQQLAGRETLIYTHFTVPWRYLARSMKRKGIEVIYDPYLAH